MEALATSKWKRSLQQRMLAWFAEQARELPWRGTQDLYAIWVSEIMLQQTQVATVVPYFQRFVQQFPTVAALAAADEHEVLRLWEGLGYYRRARQLHAAAKQIVVEHHSRFPETFAEVLALPGIGRYTAGAILSIGRDARLPILEANTVRVLSRLLAYRGDVQSTAGQQRLWQFAEELLPEEQIGHFNQSLMELGATICTPREPACLLCPVARLCPTRDRGLQDKIPAPKKKKVYEEVTEAAVVLRRADGSVLLRRCEPGERWAGLWDFPRVVAAAPEAIATAIADLIGAKVEIGEQLTTLKHGVTRFRITLKVYEGKCIGRLGSPGGSRQWVQRAALADFALSTTGRKIARLISSKGG
jgi:A/G-specific adenine glycosylase